MAAKKRQINTGLLDSVTADMLGGEEFGSFGEDNSLRVESILIDLVRPNPLQARRILPQRIYTEFHSGKMTPSQALRDLIRVAQLAASQNSRPFNNVMELLGNPNDDNNNDLPALTAEEQLLRDLVNLAVTIRDDGQVNPMTVVNVSEGVTTQFRIETGERRYWATWLLRDFMPGQESDGMIPCIVIPREKESPFRQSMENTTRSGLNAVSMARQIALILLYIYGYKMPEGPVPMSFYRQALDLDLRGKREYTDIVYSSLGGISKQRFHQYKSLLRLCDEAIEIADRNNVDDGRLRYLIELEPNDQIELLQQIVSMRLNLKQIKEIIEKGKIYFTNSEDEPEPLPRSVMQIAKLALKPSADMDAYRIAQAFTGLERDRNVAKARIRALRELLEEAELYLDNDA